MATKNTKRHEKGKKRTGIHSVVFFPFVSFRVFRGQCLSLLTSLCVLCSSVVNNAFSAPPALNYLFPAGGQRGTTVEVTASGSFERWPVQAWVSGKGVVAKPGKDKGK